MKPEPLGIFIKPTSILKKIAIACIRKGDYVDAVNCVKELEDRAEKEKQKEEMK